MFKRRDALSHASAENTANDALATHTLVLTVSRRARRPPCAQSVGLTEPGRRRNGETSNRRFAGDWCPQPVEKLTRHAMAPAIHPSLKAASLYGLFSSVLAQQCRHILVATNHRPVQRRIPAALAILYEVSTRVRPSDAGEAGDGSP